MSSSAADRAAAPVVWRPDPARLADAPIRRVVAALRRDGVGLPADDDPALFAALHAWSVADPAAFWGAMWRDADPLADGDAGRVLLGGARMAPPDPVLGPRWFPDVRLNFAENLLRHRGAGPAIIGWDETGRRGTLSRDALHDAVHATAAGLRRLGVRPGDRVAGWLPNIAEAIVAMLAAATVGAIWTSCSPDFGVDGIVDRFGQTGPVVLFWCDGYRYGGKAHPCTPRMAALLERLPSVRHAVMIPYHGDGVLPDDPRVLAWSALQDGASEDARYERLPFAHPLYILYSSGTTGLPKCLVHGAGGTLLQHLKEHRLHGDLREGERLFYFTTCGWMMWNWMVSALAVGATLVIYDGAALPEAEPELLWRMAETEGVHCFGTSAKYLALAEKVGLRPAAGRDLGTLRLLLSTGSPLMAESFDWIAEAIGPAVQIASISGGTDIVSCFVLGNPLQPVHRGEIQGPGLGMAVAVFDEAGIPAATGEAGELVCTAPFPSMPVAFWGDADGSRYRNAYFDEYPGVWRHGDWCARTASGGFVISGRSDATLNPGGVRIGTAEIYRQVEAVDDVVESLVIGQRIPGATDGDVRIVLFVRLREGVALTPALEETLRRRIRQGASPHHVPRVIVAVGDLPRTRSGKLSELAVRDVVEGRPVKNVGALANPAALDEVRDRPELR